MKKKQVVLTPLFLITIFFCSAPQQSYPVNPIPTVQVQFPSVIKRNQEEVFIVYANPNSICYIGIGYYNLNSEWKFTELPNTTANESGKCEWKWSVPEDAKDGIAEIRGYIETNGLEDRNLFPQQICIETCP